MIARLEKGCSFRGTVDYVMDTSGLNNKEVEPIAAEGLSVIIGPDGDYDYDPREIAREFRGQAMLAPRVGKPVRHLILSCHENDLERMTKDEWKDVSHEFMTRMGIVNTQYLITAHHETNNPHVHIVFNAVDYDGKRIDDRFFFDRAVRICQDITKKRGYTWGESKITSIAKDIHSPVERMRYKMAQAIALAVYESDTMDELPGKLATQGIVMDVVEHESGNKGVIFSAVDEDGKTYTFSGSRIDKMLSYYNIQRAMDTAKNLNKTVDRARALVKRYYSIPERRRNGRYAGYVGQLSSVIESMDFQRTLIEAHYPPTKAMALAIFVNAAMYGRTFYSVLYHFLKPGPNRYYGGSQPHPHGETDEERRTRKDCEKSGSLNATLEDLRYVERIN